MIKDLKSESDELSDSIASIPVYINGISYDDAWAMSYEDRKRIVKVQNKKLKEENPKAKQFM